MSVMDSYFEICQAHLKVCEARYRQRCFREANHSLERMFGCMNVVQTYLAFYEVAGGREVEGSTVVADVSEREDGSLCLMFPEFDDLMIGDFADREEAEWVAKANGWEVTREQPVVDALKAVTL